ncbi:patatin-like phospholipase family protein [Georgenia sp. TF02-10]|uniref:patatin-like phospholipase family protein n=1 Tax=Georgenia sp. TF02-10 TaxID=2917725 RepID=UPI001FA79D48|nr:patatin-like phospholipase family protein [Georgenia sp. TF02-10]UNX54845.1 patatin-like phospholipase family protein [Georgenia sp. TF02-10]
MRASPRRKPSPDVVGLVLSGGGAKASFQIGALRYLYDRVGIAPRIITGTSAGSMVAAVLAQSADGPSQRRSLGQLERLWREMRTDADMFTELEWFARLRQRGPELVGALTRRQHRQGPLGRTFARVANQALSRRDPDRPVPVRPDDPTAGSTWGPTGVVELFSALREVGRARPDLEIIVRGAERERSMYRPGPLVDRLLDPDVFDPARVASAGVVLRLAIVALESGELHYVTEDGHLVDRENRPLAEDPVDLTEAVRASCAIPSVFPPVRLGNEHYVDGGVREALPFEVAHRHLGVTRCYTVVASALGVPRQGSYAEKDMLSIVVRSTAGIMSDETLRDEVEAARAAGAVVIAPELDVHDSLVVDPGLVAISMDYGYLRAAEAVDGATDAEQQLTREIVEVRRRAWTLEAELLAPDGRADGASPVEGDDEEASVDGEAPGGGGRLAAKRGGRPAAASGSTAAGSGGPGPAGTNDPGPDGADDSGPDGSVAAGPDASGSSGPGADGGPGSGTSGMAALGALKHRLRDLVAQVPADRLPPGAEQWWQQLEGHPWEPTHRPDWVS